MMKIIKLGLVVLFLFFFIVSCKNDKDNPRFTEQRIISLSPHITEIIYALGGQDQLVAVTDYCKYPEDACKKEKIGGFLNPNIEKIISLKPTHLLGTPAHEKLNQELEKFNLEITRMDNENLSDILNCIRRTGSIIKRERIAERIIRDISNSLDSLRTSNKKNNTPSAMMIIGREKGSLRNITVTGSNTFIDEMWTLSGGNNTFSDLAARYSQVNLESILARNPDVIIELENKDIHSVKRQYLNSEWEILKDVKAVKNNNVYTISGSHTMIPGPRLVLLAKDFTKVILESNSD